MCVVRRPDGRSTDGRWKVTERKSDGYLRVALVWRAGSHREDIRLGRRMPTDTFDEICRYVKPYFLPGVQIFPDKPIPVRPQERAAVFVMAPDTEQEEVVAQTLENLGDYLLTAGFGAEKIMWDGEKIQVTLSPLCSPANALSVPPSWEGYRVVVHLPAVAGEPGRQEFFSCGPTIACRFFKFLTMVLRRRNQMSPSNFTRDGGPHRPLEFVIGGREVGVYPNFVGQFWMANKDEEEQAYQAAAAAADIIKRHDGSPGPQILGSYDDRRTWNNVTEKLKEENDAK